MVRVRMLISLCTCSQVTRSMTPICARATPAIGVKARPSAAIRGSVAIIIQAAAASSRTRVRAVIMPFWMNDRAPSKSSMPRVIRSPEWILS